MKSILTICGLCVSLLLFGQDEKDKINQDKDIDLEKKGNALDWPKKDSAKSKELEDVLKNRKTPADSLMPVNKKKCRMEALLQLEDHHFRHEECI